MNTNPNPPNISTGEKWFVKEEGQKHLNIYEIFDVTDQTVLMRKETDVRTLRYRKSDIIFVERVYTFEEN
jgi:hypothetical protein